MALDTQLAGVMLARTGKEADMQDGGIQAARECLEREDTDEALKLYERLRAGRHKAEADLAVALCKFYKAKQMGNFEYICQCYDWMVHYLYNYYFENSLGSADAQFALIFAPLLVKAWNTNKHKNPDYFYRGRSSEDANIEGWVVPEASGGNSPERTKMRRGSSAAPDMPFGEIEKYVPKQVPEFLPIHLVRMLNPDYRRECELSHMDRCGYYLLFIKTREIFMDALASDEFARLQDDRKQSLFKAAVFLDKFFLDKLYSKSWFISSFDNTKWMKDQHAEQMSGIYKTLGREDWRGIWKDEERKARFGGEFSYFSIFLVIMMIIIIIGLAIVLHDHDVREKNWDCVRIYNIECNIDVLA